MNALLLLVCFALAPQDGGNFIRTYDLSGVAPTYYEMEPENPDSLFPYFNPRANGDYTEAYEPHEENPMIGFRGASRYVHPEFRDCFALECRAVRKVRDEMGLTNCWIMIPFVRTLGEGRAVVETLVITSYSIHYTKLYDLWAPHGEAPAGTDLDGGGLTCVIAKWREMCIVCERLYAAPFGLKLFA